MKYIWKQSENVARTLQIMCVFFGKKLILQQRKKRMIFIVSPSSFICMDLIGFLVFGFERVRNKTRTKKMISFFLCFNNSPLYIISHSLCGDFNFNFQFKSFPIKFHLLNGKRGVCAWEIWLTIGWLALKNLQRSWCFCCFVLVSIGPKLSFQFDWT